LHRARTCAYAPEMAAARRIWSALKWPPVIVVALFAIASEAFPNRYMLFSGSLAHVASIVIYATFAASFISHVIPGLHRFERPAAFAATILASACAAAYFFTIISLIANGGDNVKGGLLLEAAILVWVITVLAFSLWYWLIDDGTAFFFPQYGSDWHPAWKPTFTDYLFLSFTTSTAFSPTDVAPASRTAKMLMLVQSSLSLATVAIAAARAINVL
jgi:uncharacterized membrane protein